VLTPPRLKSFVKHCLDYLVYVLVRMVLAVVQAVPMSACQRLADPLAWLCCRLRVRHNVIEDNLRHAFPDMPEPERRRIERAHWRHLVLMIFEMAHADRLIHDTNWRHYVRLHEMQPMVRQMLTTRPSVVVAGHFGNFEISARQLGLFGFATFVVARPLDNPYLDRWLNRFRGRFGQFILPKKGSANDADARLAAGGTLAVLGDQSAGPKGCFVEFFGRPASTHKAIAVMALAHQAPLMVTYARRSGEPLQFEIGCPAIADPRDVGPETAGVRELTQWYSQQLESIVRRDPEQYWWVHRRWKDQPKKKTGEVKLKAVA
jgi:KDO2-lipid IV(A) lauroyltransferase